MDYKDTPKYILHYEPSPDGKGTEPINVYATANGINVNGTEYYSKEKVDTLVAETESDIREWATNQFQPKV